MNTVERIKNICKERKIPVSRLERECGFATGYISQLKKGSLPDDRLRKVAEYLNLPFEYLMNGVWEQQHYMDDETAEIAQWVFENQSGRLLFKAARRCSPDSILLAAKILEKLKETNPDG